MSPFHLSVYHCHGLCTYSGEKTQEGLSWVAYCPSGSQRLSSPPCTTMFYSPGIAAVIFWLTCDKCSIFQLQAFSRCIFLLLCVSPNAHVCRYSQKPQVVIVLNVGVGKQTWVFCKSRKLIWPRSYLSSATARFLNALCHPSMSCLQQLGGTDNLEQGLAVQKKHTSTHHFTIIELLFLCTQSVCSYGCLANCQRFPVLTSSKERGHSGHLSKTVRFW